MIQVDNNIPRKDSYVDVRYRIQISGNTLSEICVITKENDTVHAMVVGENDPDWKSKPKIISMSPEEFSSFNEIGILENGQRKWFPVRKFFLNIATIDVSDGGTWDPAQIWEDPNGTSVPGSTGPQPNTGNPPYDTIGRNYYPWEGGGFPTAPYEVTYVPIKENEEPCLHDSFNDSCTRCSGKCTCPRSLSCPCPKCTPRC